MARVIEAGNSDTKSVHSFAETNAGFRKLIENSYEGITLLDENLQVIYRSESAKRINGWDTSERAKKPMIELIHPDDRELIIALLPRVFADPGRSHVITFRSQHVNGYYIWLEAIFTNYLNDPDIKAIVCNFRDITQLKARIRQTEEILENLNDGFISLDKNLCYTYVNKQLTEMVGIKAQDLLGKYIWDVFPDSIGTATYDAITTAVKENRYICNIDYYAPLNLWQETRIYPSDDGISIFIRDITRQKQEEQYLKMLQSVVTQATDAVIITEAARTSEPGPRILYVNEAFTQMTGYTADEVIGRSPRFLQGPATDQQELQKLSSCMKQNQPCEISVINYKKNGEEFWVNLSVVPVADDKGNFTHWIAIERDITRRKNDELQKSLLADISSTFNETATLNDSLQRTLKLLVSYGNFTLAEVWLVDTDKKRIHLAAQYSEDDQIQGFLRQTQEMKSSIKGTGLVGTAWEAQQLQYWHHSDVHEDFLRMNIAKKEGLKRAYALPLFYNSEVVGVLTFITFRDEAPGLGLSTALENFSTHMGAEIRRKQVEEELEMVFNYAPDIICITGYDGYVKKINPAGCLLLGYTEEELLTRPFINFIHPEDRAKGLKGFEALKKDPSTFHFEDRCITGGGAVKWLSWTVAPSYQKGLLFCVAKDITEKKEMEQLLTRATSLARIGAWEVDLERQMVHWSDITREIHEVEPGYNPDLATGIGFYKEEYRAIIEDALSRAKNDGTPADLELQIVTAKGNSKWIRVIVEAEFKEGLCTRLYGSFQDIDARKKAVLAANAALSERNTILESIGDVFFALDKNWVVTYWNNTAEQEFGKLRSEIIGRNVLEVYPDLIGQQSYQMYHKAVEEQHSVHFENHYRVLNKWYEISAYPSQGGLSVYFKDITERKLAGIRLIELNVSLQKKARELAISNAELEQFAYVASHDLQEPLRMVTSFLTQLEKKYGDVVDDKGKQYIHFAVDGAKRMRQIILDLLEFSRVGAADEPPEDVNLHDVVNEIIALHRKKIEDEHATITAENLPVISTHKTPIRQVLQNIIGNALKYHKKGVPPSVNVSCTETKTSWQIAVTDNGIGIDPEFSNKIFVIFQQLHPKDEYPGTGMGLAIAKKIVENAGGKIWVESEEGKGSTFYFTILKTPRP